MFLLERKTMLGLRDYLTERECAPATVTKYMHDVGLLAAFCGGRIEDKGTLIAFKQYLQEQGYAPASVNSMLAAVNRFLDFAGHPEWKLRYLKAPRSTFCDREKELTQQDYGRLVRLAREQGNERLELLVQTICATGIRVSEVRAITAESLKSGRAEIHNNPHYVVLLKSHIIRIMW